MFHQQLPQHEGVLQRGVEVLEGLHVVILHEEQRMLKTPRIRTSGQQAKGWIQGYQEGDDQYLPGWNIFQDQFILESYRSNDFLPD